MINRLLAILAVCAFLVLPGTALAQDDEQQSLPDPNGSQKSEAQANSPEASNLPNTGTSVALLFAAGMTLLATGVAVRPLQRRRRAYSSDVWLEAVRADGRRSE